MFASLRSGTTRASALAARRFSSSSGGGGGGSSAALPAAISALAATGYLYKLSIENQERINELQVEISGKTNSAFVFIKPHACKGKDGAVEDVLESKFKDSKIRIIEKGSAATVGVCILVHANPLLFSPPLLSI